MLCSSRRKPAKKRWSTPRPASASEIRNAVQEFLDVGRTSVPRADCGPGAAPENGLQGDVTAADRDSGRSTQGYRCNISFVGGYAGRGAGITSTSFINFF